MTVRADLHNHSCLSPCGDLAMSPTALAATAASRGIDLLALTDHNCSKNGPAFRDACEKAGIVPIFGMEVTSQEEVHLLALFGSLDAALDLDNLVYELLPDIRNVPERFGDQVIVDVEEFILGEVDKFLLPAINLGIDEIGEEIHAREGLFIPAHVDRSSYSMLSQLGFLPDGAYDGVEVTKWPAPAGAERYTLVSDSDAHFLDDVARRSFTFEGEGPSFSALREALLRGETKLSIHP